MDSLDQANQPDLTTKRPQNEILVFEVEKDSFKDFISSLLGKPQTIEKTIRGAFEVDQKTVTNLNYLIDQRISQQNKGTLVQFTAKILYNDSSSVMLNSLDEFISYNEVHPIISTGLHLTWTYLIKFRDKKALEKQLIEISFLSSGFGDSSFDGEVAIPFLQFNGKIKIKISHTARTWGMDMESILTGSLSRLIKDEQSVKRLICKHPIWTALLAGMIVFISNWLAIRYFINTKKFAILNSANLIIEQGGSNISEKLNFIMTAIANNTWGQIDDMKQLLFVGLVGLTIILTLTVYYFARNQPKSFILLTEKAIESRDANNKKRDRKWLWLIISFTASIISSVLSRIIFAKFFEH